MTFPQADAIAVSLFKEIQDFLLACGLHDILHLWKNYGRLFSNPCCVGNHDHKNGGPADMGHYPDILHLSVNILQPMTGFHWLHLCLLWAFKAKAGTFLNLQYMLSCSTLRHHLADKSCSLLLPCFANGKFSNAGPP